MPEGGVTRSLRLWTCVAVVLHVGCSGVPAESPNRSPVDSAVLGLGDGFVSRRANVNGTTLHYVRGGAGPAVILLHGFPQDWSAFRRIMPRLAAKFTVLAVDMRGVGESAIADSYDAATVAEDIRQLARELDLGSIYVAGHDNGGMVAYTFARLYPDSTRGIMILDVPLPGIEPWEQIKADPALWHFGFHQTADLPEQLIAGREFIYFRAFFDRLALRREAISDEDVAHYVRAYTGVERLRAGLGFYRRAYPTSETFNAATGGPLRVPIVLAGGDRSMGPANMTIAKALREHGCEAVTVEPVRESGHWVVDEQPATVAGLIERYAAR
jgi:pimeloyl-ACP methyl ester carboxylesterase